jgi:hypothetical protein
MLAKQVPMFRRQTGERSSFSGSISGLTPVDGQFPITSDENKERREGRHKL